MNTTNDAIDIIWKKLNTTVKQQITGDVYKLNRRINSDKEDIVINSLPISPDFPESCVVNVNIYVPNISVKIYGKVDNTMPDTLRLKQLTKLVRQQLESVSEAHYIYSYDGQAVIPSPETNEYYSNIRVYFVFAGEEAAMTEE